MKFHAVTTCNAEGWEQYGRRMASSFRQMWPADVTLTIYAEGFDVAPEQGIEVRALPSWLGEFKKRHRKNPEAHGLIDKKYRFRKDCVKFSHKVAAITDLAAKLNEGILIALDADIVTHTRVTKDWLEALLPKPSYLAWLDRAKTYPECGFVMYRCDHAFHQQFIAGFRALYETDAVFALAQTHDSYVLQEWANQKAKSGMIEPPISLSGPARQYHHVFVASILGARMDHLKGNRKLAGKSGREETFGRRPEEYWQS